MLFTDKNFELSGQNPYRGQILRINTEVSYRWRPAKSIWRSVGNNGSGDTIPRPSNRPPLRPDAMKSVPKTRMSR